MVRRYLEASGYRAPVVHGGVDAIEEVRRSRPDLLVLDVMMPQLNGIEVCRVLRRESNVPVLMLTARRDEDDLLLGLDAGADDYLMKPYNPRELMARVRTMLRRTRWTPAEPQTMLRVGEIVVDVRGHHVTSVGRRVDCTPGEFGSQKSRYMALYRRDHRHRRVTNAAVRRALVNLNSDLPSDKGKAGRWLTDPAERSAVLALWGVEDPGTP
ncbi:hypothetical protein Ahu01nite_060980 [Winogradskya humida]|uniref:Response regulatory domain-containing protein n=1 Tax=Winogradskya humida TaxID=113566 RepID=A0ABQ3ZWM1_9ACTN|nr:hypothetical protein Ahu01nite_060980 [Actinoplanes humidus]